MSRGTANLKSPTRWGVVPTEPQLHQMEPERQRKSEPLAVAASNSLQSLDLLLCTFLAPPLLLEARVQVG